MAGRYVPECKPDGSGGVWVVRDLRDPYETLVTHACTGRVLTFPDEPAAVAWAQREHDLDEQFQARPAVTEVAP